MKTKYNCEDYISREAAIAETRNPRLTDAELRRRLALIPAADVAEVVRCRDCENYREKFFDDGRSYGFFCDLMHFDRGKDFWCADGKRKDGGQDE